MKKFKAYQDCSAVDWKTMISKILICHGNKHYSLRLIHQGTQIWKVLCVSKLQNSSQLQTIVALYNPEILRGGGERDHHRCVKLQIEHAQWNKNFRIQNEVKERGTVIKGEKGQKSFIGLKTGECFQWKTNVSCSKGESCSFLFEPAVGKSLHAQEKVAKNRWISPATSHGKPCAWKKGWRTSIFFCSKSEKKNWCTMLVQ